MYGELACSLFSFPPPPLPPAASQPSSGGSLHTPSGPAQDSFLLKETFPTTAACSGGQAVGFRRDTLGCYGCWGCSHTSGLLVEHLNLLHRAEAGPQVVPSSFPPARRR